MTRLIFRSGLDTIGGTIIELINGDNRLIFDFGTVFDPSQGDDKLPAVSGVYDGSGEYNDFILISHIHLDHIKAVNKVDKSVPVYMHSKSIAMLDSLKTVGFNKLFGQWRSYLALDEATNIGGFKVTPVLVDHDVPGAVAFIFENEDLTLVYSGDLRLHGLHGERTHNLIDICKQLNVDVLISEGVTISFIEDDYKIIASDEVLVSESQFADVIKEQIDSSKTQFFNSYIMGIERLQTIAKLARMTNKKLVLTAASGYIAKKHLNLSECYVLNEDTYASGYTILKLANIDAQCIVQFDYEQRLEMSDVINGQQLIQTGGEPLGDFDPRYQQMKQFLADLNVDLIEASLGGHASVENLQYICNQINPQYTIPLHSFKRELLSAANSVQLLPEENDQYIFSNHKLQT